MDDILEAMGAPPPPARIGSGSEAQSWEGPRSDTPVRHTEEYIDARYTATPRAPCQVLELHAADVHRQPLSNMRGRLLAVMGKRVRTSSLPRNVPPPGTSGWPSSRCACQCTARRPPPLHPHIHRAWLSLVIPCSFVTSWDRSVRRWSICTPTRCRAVQRQVCRAQLSQGPCSQMICRHEASNFCGLVFWRHLRDTMSKLLDAFRGVCC